VIVILIIGVPPLFVDGVLTVNIMTERLRSDQASFAASAAGCVPVESAAL
jgi:hypothetical protein